MHTRRLPSTIWTAETNPRNKHPVLINRRNARQDSVRVWYLLTSQRVSIELRSLGGSMISKYLPTVREDHAIIALKMWWS